MRTALYEALHEDDVPVEVAIDEAVELAKEYCGADAPGFVNGVLGRGPGGARRRRLMAASLEGVEGLLLDLSGVIYVQDEAVPGAAEALGALARRRDPDPPGHQHDDAARAARSSSAWSGSGSRPTRPS